MARDRATRGNARRPGPEAASVAEGDVAGMHVRHPNAVTFEKAQDRLALPPSAGRIAPVCRLANR